MSLKTGANKVEQNKIARYLEQGYTAEEIGQMLYMKPEVVKRFTPKKQAASKEKVKKTNAKAEKEHIEKVAAKKKAGIPDIDPSAPKPTE